MRPLALALLLPLSSPLSGAPPAPAAHVARVILETGLGEIEVEVDLARAPVTARNFLRYVEDGRYDGGRFHRTVTPENQPDKRVKIDVIQAGVAPGREKDDRAPIPLERTRDTGLAHVDGAVSMARDTPDSATSDFFVCVGDQPSLDFGGARNPDGQGFAAFGRVVRGMDVVRTVWRSPAKGQALDPPVPILRARVVPTGAPAETK
ncbi:MAG: peptidylprolyl isomerase [Thermoanaerobaculia bacterium]